MSILGVGDLFTAPMDIIEGIKDQNLQRQLEGRGVELGLSMGITALWNLGRIPIIGRAFRSAAMAGYLNWIREPNPVALQITVPDAMNDPKNRQHYATERK